MATTELDGLIMRTTIILDKPEDWEVWIFLRKDSANRHHLWSMVDPDLGETAFKNLDETEEDTSVLMRDMPTEKFQRYQQAEKNYD
jgi:hypothetical protein